MRYIVKQKINIADLVNLERLPHRVLIHEPEEYLLDLYNYHLAKHNFEVQSCQDVSKLEDCLVIFKPKVLIFNIDIQPNQSFQSHWLMSFKRKYPEINIITTGYNTDAEQLKVLLGLGVSSHVNRKLSRPQDLVVLVQAIIKN